MSTNAAQKIYDNDYNQDLDVELQSDKSVLIVDDDPIILEQLKLYVGKKYKKVYAFSSIEQFNIFIKNSKVLFDYCFVDYFMKKKKKGSEIINQIPRSDKCLIYIISGDVEMISLPPELSGVDSFIDKPITYQSISNLLK